MKNVNLASGVQIFFNLITAFGTEARVVNLVMNAVLFKFSWPTVIVS